MGLEKTLWVWFRDNAKTIEGLGLQRIESHISSGVPDVFGHLETTSFWIENKACDRPVRPSSLLRFDITREQIIWQHKWWRRGCRCYVLARVGRGAKARLYLIEGYDAHLVDKCLESDLEYLSVLDSNRADPEAIVRKIIDRGQHLKIN